MKIAHSPSPIRAFRMGEGGQEPPVAFKSLSNRLNDCWIFILLHCPGNLSLNVSSTPLP